MRERPGDILLLAHHFLSEFRPGEDAEWTIAPEAAALLENYPWPGNVRELRNVVERAALLGRGRTVRAADLGSSLSEDPPVASGEAPKDGLPTLNVGELERLAVEEALERTGWHQGRAAELLGVSDRTLHRKIKGYGLQRPE